MKDNKHIYISVYLHSKGFVPAGVITFNEEANFGGFSYFPGYMEENYPPLNPATLNWRDGNQRHFMVSPNNNTLLDRTFWKLLPQKNEWGYRVLVSRYPEYSSMKEAAKLHFLGQRQIGGISAWVSKESIESSINSLDWLDKIRQESVDFYMHNLPRITHVKAINPLTSYGGARPKCMFEDEYGVFWIAKFNLPTDPYNMAKAEHVALTMAREAGAVVAESKVLELASGENVFLSKRFDRENEERAHTLSLYSLAPGNELHKNLGIPGNPGGFMQTLVRRYSDFKDQDTAGLVLKMLLDIGLNNTDNHLRNTRIMLNKELKWQLTPMFDVVFNPSELPHTYNPAGLPLKEMFLDNPALSEAMSKELQVTPEIVYNKIQQVKAVSDNWESYCDKAQVSEEDKVKIGNAVSLGRKRVEINKKLRNKIQVKSPQITPKLTPNLTHKLSTALKHKP